MLRAVYPGSFDPVTNGHLDIIHRAAKIVQSLIVAPVKDNNKKYSFDINQRVMYLKILTRDISNVIIKDFDGLLIKFAQENKINIIIRGLRAVTDFEYEFQMALANRSLDKNIETLFISTSVDYLYLSSSVVKEVARFGGDITNMVPSEIKKFILDKFIY